jgi:hypothetical protein
MTFLPLVHHIDLHLPHLKGHEYKTKLELEKIDNSIEFFKLSYLSLSTTSHD